MRRIAMILAVAGMTAATQAEVKLPTYFNENMVMQQNHEIVVPAKAKANAEVKITPSWSGKTVKARSDRDGNFVIKLTAPAAGGPFSITFDDGDVTTIGNLLSGEVWLCSGQSNMEFPVKGWGSLPDADEVIAMAHNPAIRLFQVKKAMAFTPQDDVEVNMGGWNECTSATVPNFSAVAYLFARELAEQLNVPIGVIDTSWGGTAAEAWTGFDAVNSVPGFEKEIKLMTDNGFDAKAMTDGYDRLEQQWRVMAEKDPLVFDKGVYQSGWKKIEMPSFFDLDAEQGLDGIVWLQKKFEIPQSWQGREMTLRLAAIDDEDIVYLNGREVARGWGFAAERVYTIPADKVDGGEAVLSVRVLDTGGEGGMNPAIGEVSATVDDERIDLSGEWQYKVSSDYRQLPSRPIHPSSANFPTVLYNAMLYPLHNLPVKGYLWYQGCTNVGRADQYAELLPAMVNNWRKDWGEDNSFYLVQLAGFLTPRSCQPDSEWAALRNAQLSVLALPATGVATAIDLGNPIDIHPRNKQDVAARLAAIALNRDYGRDVEYKAPALAEVVTKGDKMLLTFDAPVEAKGSAVIGFIIGDKDGNWSQAQARMLADGRIEISSSSVKKPVAVRYDWADYPNGNLYGKNGLPVIPFATDK